MKPHILIVEDEALLHERLRKNLVREGFSVDKYTKSYDEALSRLQEKTPDIVLLDIELQGEKTGNDLGKLLNKTYHIPFIYLTNHSDNITFERSLFSNHEQFIIKTKPLLNVQQVVLAIKTVLHKKDKQKLECFTKQGVLGLPNYKEEIQKMDNEAVSAVPVNFEDIALFTVGQYEDENGVIVGIKKDYCVFLTTAKRVYFMNKPLKEIRSHLPSYFVQISASAIVNISPGGFDGRINGARIKILGRTLAITQKYKEELNRKVEHYYYG